MMYSVNVQFHMLLDELISMIAELAARHSLAIELERWHPKATSNMSAGTDLAAKARAFGRVDRIWLLYMPRHSDTVERFMLNVGNLRGNRLGQAQLGAGARTKEALGVLKEIAAELRRRTRAGLWVVTATGHVNFTKMFRISDRAADAARSGQIQLTDIAFGQDMYVELPG